MSNFFRKDLNLGKKWGHRLLSVIFFGLFIYCLFSVSKSILFEGGLRPIHEVQSSLANRITSEVKLVRDLANPGEEIDTTPYGVNIFLFWFYGKDKYQGLIDNDEFEEYILNQTYCSTQLYNQINEVIKKTGISKFYIKEINNYLKPISKKTATDYIKNNNVKCILIDGFGGENKFLNPGRVAQEYQNNYYFYKKTGFANFLTIMEFTTGIITIAVGLAIPFCLIILIYYKIILYVIYGGRKIK